MMTDRLILIVIRSPGQLVTTPDSVLAFETGLSPVVISQFATFTPQS